ncbi:hypothetical protein O1L55_03225 [Streptomyces albulus]|nr:hypothetical protein [Streptomyces noursei]
MNPLNSKDITTMRSNIRRSIAVAATATGLWALGTVAANAAELPATGDLPAVGSVTGAAGQLPTGAVTGTVQKAAGTATKTVSGAADKATGALGGGVSANELPTGRLPQTGGVVDGARRLVGGGLPALNTGGVQKAVDVQRVAEVADAGKQLGKVTDGVKAADLSKAGSLVNGKLPAVPGVPAAELPGGLPKGLPACRRCPRPCPAQGPRAAQGAGLGRQPAGRPRGRRAASRAADRAGPGRPGHRASGRGPHLRRRAAAGRRPGGRQVLPVAQGAVGNVGALAGDAAGQATRSRPPSAAAPRSSRSTCRARRCRSRRASAARPPCWPRASAATPCRSRGAW